MPLHHPPRSKIRLRRSGGQEVEKESGDSVGGFVSLYALHNWIPASAGMAEESVHLRRTEGLGVSPNSPIPPPRVGARGLKASPHTRHGRGIKAVAVRQVARLLGRRNAGQGIEGFRGAEDVGLTRDSHRQEGILHSKMPIPLARR